MSKAMSAELKAIATPPADASRVAAIRNSVNLRDREALSAFGERARLEVAASVQRILAEVRSAEAAEAADLLRHAAELIEARDPARLQVGGLARLFTGRRRRLAAFRTEFQDAVAVLDTVSGDLGERAERLARRASVLDRLHEQARTFILELDAYLDAGRQAVAAAREDAAEARRVIEARLETLTVARRCAIEQLSLVRVVQNVDAPTADALAAAVRAARRWAADWTELLGLSAERRGKRMRPDIVALYETKALALEGLVAPTAALAEARLRRLDAESEMEQAARMLGGPRRR
jgi:uncharacterized protein YaaN involved in tellurite resistance